MSHCKVNCGDNRRVNSASCWMLAPGPRRYLQPHQHAAAEKLGWPRTDGWSNIPQHENAFVIYLLGSRSVLLTYVFSSTGHYSPCPADAHSAASRSEVSPQRTMLSSSSTSPCSGSALQHASLDLVPPPALSFSLIVIPLPPRVSLLAEPLTRCVIFI